MVSLHKLARKSRNFDAKTFRDVLQASTIKALRHTYKNGRTALHEAGALRNQVAVHLLLQRAAALLTPAQYKAYVNSRDGLGCTPDPVRGRRKHPWLGRRGPPDGAHLPAAAGASVDVWSAQPIHAAIGNDMKCGFGCTVAVSSCVACGTLPPMFGTWVPWRYARSTPISRG